MSEDLQKIRSKENTDKWRIEVPTIATSTLHPDVPEFVPGQTYHLPSEHGTGTISLDNLLLKKILKEEICLTLSGFQMYTYHNWELRPSSNSLALLG
jgi:hypothetical protein